MHANLLIPNLANWHHSVAILALALCLGWYFSIQVDHVTGRCRPHEPCWPTAAIWSRLNTSIDGNLIQLRPIEHVCYGKSLEAKACEHVLVHSRDSGWRASQPGALQDWVWESGLSANETCFPEANQATTCSQGRIPLYSAIVKSAQHVQAAVNFARKHNLRLVIKNTGHDGSRSSSPGSFQIHTNLLKSIQYHDDFLIEGAVEASGPAVTIGAGVMHYEVYDRGAREGFMIVGGECPTVGAAGGFLQGGGVSSFHSLKRGLAVDNVLQYEVVTANGKLVTVNRYNNPDLYWALSGGGGGTFGIVVEATVRAYPDDPGVVPTISLTTLRPNTDLFWSRGVAGLLRILQTSNRENIAGQFMLIPYSTSTEASLTLYFVNITDTSMVEAKMKAQINSLMSSSGVSITLSTRFQARLSSEVPMAPTIYPDNYGILSSSVLISNRHFNSTEGPRLISERLSKFPMDPGDILFTSNLGGQVLRQSPVDTPLHPAWRSSSQLVTYVRAVEMSIEGKVFALQDLTNVQMPILYSLDPHSKVSYRNLGDPNEVDWQQVYWGSDNYERLLRIKKKVDPQDLFITRKGVGSESWSEEGMCKAQRSVRFGMLRRTFT